MGTITITVLPKPKTMGKLKSVSYTDRKWGNGEMPNYYTERKWGNARLIGPAVTVTVNTGRQAADTGVQPRDIGQARRRRGKEGEQVTIQGSAEPVGLA